MTPGGDSFFSPWDIVAEQFERDPKFYHLFFIAFSPLQTQKTSTLRFRAGRAAGTDHKAMLP